MQSKDYPGYDKIIDDLEPRDHRHAGRRAAPPGSARPTTSPNRSSDYVDRVGGFESASLQVNFNTVPYERCRALGAPLRRKGDAALRQALTLTRSRSMFALRQFAITTILRHILIYKVTRAPLPRPGITHMPRLLPATERRPSLVRLSKTDRVLGERAAEDVDVFFGETVDLAAAQRARRADRAGARSLSARAMLAA